MLCIATYAMYSGVAAEKGDECGNCGKRWLYLAEANTNGGGRIVQSRKRINRRAAGCNGANVL